MIRVWEAFDALKFGTEKHQYLHALQPKDGSRKESTLPNLFQCVNLAPCLIAPCLGKPYIPTFFFAVIRLLDSNTMILDSMAGFAIFFLSMPF